MIKVNYELKMQELIKELKKENQHPSVLLHTCCAPCCSAVIEHLKETFGLSLFFYNPNITIEDEYHKRYEELIDYIGKRHYNISIEEGRYNPKDDFFSKVKGLESAREGGERCYECYKLRMEETAKRAKEEGYEYFTTALSISPMKNSKWINEIGEELSKKYDIKYLYGDFKKKGRYKESIEISKDYDLYRQDYCGCIFSKVERENHIKEKIRREQENNAKEEAV